MLERQAAKVRSVVVTDRRKVLSAQCKVVKQMNFALSTSHFPFS